jgi:hypothetical protein
MRHIKKIKQTNKQKMSKISLHSAKENKTLATPFALFVTTTLLK